LFDQHIALKSFLVGIFNGFKKSYGQSILGPIHSSRESFVLKNIFGKANEAIDSKEFFLDMSVFTFNCAFGLEDLKSFLDSYKNNVQKINVN
jgi:hypothetical protein